MVSEGERGYIAGLIDGEGSILLTRRSRGKRALFQPSVNITNVDEAVLIFIRNLTEVTGSLFPEERGGNRRTLYTLRLQSLSDVKRILEIAQPYLKIKKRQCNLLLEFCDIRATLRKKSQGWSNQHKSSRLAREFEIYEEMRPLNHRGLTRL